MKKTANISVVQLFAFALWLCSGPQAVAQDQLTVQSINSINGFHESITHIGNSFQNEIDEYSGPKPEKLVDVWEVAAEAAFDADRLIAAVDAQMEGRFTDAELQELYDYFSSPFGAKIVALEVASASNTGDTAARTAEGAGIFTNLAANDPDRLALYKQMLDAMEAFDVTEAVILNMAYSIMAGVVGAAGAPVTDEQMITMVKQATAGLREDVEKTLQAQTALTYRDLTNEELERYVEFLETPSGSHYYEVSMQALDKAISKEARDFGNRLFAALGMRKA